MSMSAAGGAEGADGADGADGANGADGRRRHWQRTRVLTAALLVLWFGATFVVTFFARALSFEFFGWPFGFWFAAQGSLLVYLVLVGFYAWRMRRLDAGQGAPRPPERPQED